MLFLKIDSMVYTVYPTNGNFWQSEGFTIGLGTRIFRHTHVGKLRFPKENGPDNDHIDDAIDSTIYTYIYRLWDQPRWLLIYIYIFKIIIIIFIIIIAIWLFIYLLLLLFIFFLLYIYVIAEGHRQCSHWPGSELQTWRPFASPPCWTMMSS